jgi:hypothetical protein
MHSTGNTRHWEMKYSWTPWSVRGQAGKRPSRQIHRSAWGLADVLPFCPDPALLGEGLCLGTSGPFCHQDGWLGIQDSGGSPGIEPSLSSSLPLRLQPLNSASLPGPHLHDVKGSPSNSQCSILLDPVHSSEQDSSEALRCRNAD